MINKIIKNTAYYEPDYSGILILIVSLLIIIRSLWILISCYYDRNMQSPEEWLEEMENGYSIQYCSIMVDYYHDLWREKKAVMKE